MLHNFFFLGKNPRPPQGVFCGGAMEVVDGISCRARGRERKQRYPPPIARSTRRPCRSCLCLLGLWFGYRTARWASRHLSWLCPPFLFLLLKKLFVNKFVDFFVYFFYFFYFKPFNIFISFKPSYLSSGVLPYFSI